MNSTSFSPRYAGNWLALTDELHVVVSASSSQQAVRMSRELGFYDPVLLQRQERIIN